METGPAARSAGTRRRLLEAAVQVFAEEGFRNATLQEIARRADANVASTAYHFGGKEGLYAAVFEYAEEQAAAAHPAPEDGDGLPAEERLRRHVTSFLSRLLDPDRQAWFARILAREMIEPTPALDRVVRRRMRANHEQLSAIVRDLLGADADDDTVRLCVLSVIAQCTFYRNSAPIIGRLYPDLEPGRQIDRLADHVTEFSLAAVRGIAEARAGARRARRAVGKERRR
jgi:AcrR family transcriptional regulator